MSSKPYWGSTLVGFTFIRHCLDSKSFHYYCPFLSSEILFTCRRALLRLGCFNGSLKRFCPGIVSLLLSLRCFSKWSESFQSSAFYVSTNTNFKISCFIGEGRHWPRLPGSFLPPRQSISCACKFLSFFLFRRIPLLERSNLVPLGGKPVPLASWSSWVLHDCRASSPALFRLVCFFCLLLYFNTLDIFDEIYGFTSVIVYSAPLIQVRCQTIQFFRYFLRLFGT
jgi:hypothetical protein